MKENGGREHVNVKKLEEIYKLRDVCLFEADFNCWKKLVFAR